MKDLFAAALAALLTLVAASAANAQATRTWVSGSLFADDANAASNCSRSAPCRSFATALSVTATGGEITCLDPGSNQFGDAGGGVTITGSVTIDCETVTTAVTSASIVITAGTVTLRGIDLLGKSAATHGVRVTGAANVKIQNSKITGYTTAGVSFESSGTLVITDSKIQGNAAGVLVDGTTGANTTIVRNSVVSANTGNGITVQTSGAAPQATIDRTTIASNGGAGLAVSGSGATVRLGGSTITGNATGVSVPSGTLYSFKDNQIAGNTSNGTPITAVPGSGGPLQ